MAIVFEGKTYDQDWHEIDAMGNRIGGGKDVRANADYASKTGTQNPYTNQAGSSIHDASGLTPGNEPGSTLPKGPTPGGWLDHAKIAAYQQSLRQPQTFTSGSQSPYTQMAQPQRQTPSQSQAPATNPAVYTDMDQARRGLEAVYQQFLGRPANPGDADKWLTGQFGHGSGVQDYDKYVAAIMGSDEARNYRPAAPPPGSGGALQGLEYWQSQGVPAFDIFDPMTGQLRPGWVRTAAGYARDSNAQQTTNIGGRPDPGPPRSQSAGDIQPWFLSLVQGLPPSPQSLKQLEPILNRYGIRLGPPNARGWSDGIFLPDGTFYDVIIAATENGGQGWSFFQPGPSTPQGDGGGIGGVNLPQSQYSDPHTKLLEEMKLGRINALQSGSDPAYQQLLQYLQQRFTDLQGPGRTGAEQEVIRTQALDPIERDRTTAKKRMMERISAMGYTLESGVAQQLLQEVDKEFDSFRAQSQSMMATDELNRREGRNQYAEGLAMSLYGLPQDRAREALGYAGSLSDLGPQRLQLAMQAAGMGGNPSSMFSNLMQLAQMNQQSQLYNQQNSSQWYNALGSVAAMLMNAGR